MNARTTSTAVMARRVEPADSLDFFPTPPWGTRALCQHVLPRFETVDPDTGLFPLSALDPACGEGHMALALREYFPLATASDIFDYGFGGVADFLHPDEKFGPRDWIISNPPFNLGAKFVRKALSVARRGVAMLVRTAFLEGEERHAALYAENPPSMIAIFSERLPMHRGRWVVNGKSATSYSWLVWFTGRDSNAEPAFMWIPKSRRALSRHDDWLRFHGCWDLPATHKALKLAKAGGRRHALSVDAVRFNMSRGRPKPASIGDVRQHMEALL